jgi:hypothetical protein
MANSPWLSSKYWSLIIIKYKGALYLYTVVIEKEFISKEKKITSKVYKAL